MIHVDQSPIGRTPRSNPATYTGVFDHIRKLFASTPEAKMRGYLQGRFSFNVKGGRCEACSGDGTIKIEMNFLPDVYVPCEVCHGARYNRETLEVHYKGKTIAEVLDMPIEEAADFFAAVPPIARHMKTLCEVGLGYVRLGQPATTLSGGEAQRVKLSSELQKRSTGSTVYVLDEPTTGLHFEDIRRLLGVLSSLVDKGNTVLVIEHNLDVIKTSDWVVDMGPEGGSRGGTVIAEGTPEDVAANPDSYTGQFLAPILARRPHPRPSPANGLRARSSLPPDEGGRPMTTRRRMTRSPAATCSAEPLPWGSADRCSPRVAADVDDSTADAPSGPTIRCACHNSIFSAVDGSVLSGPAPSALSSEPFREGPGHRGRRSGGRVQGRRARGERHGLQGPVGRGDPAGAWRLQGVLCRLHAPGLPGRQRRTGMSHKPTSRRIVFQGLSALGVAAVLAGCGGEEQQPPRAAEPSATDDSPSPSKPGKPLRQRAEGASCEALATTDEVPVGGGIDPQ